MTDYAATERLANLLPMPLATLVWGGTLDDACTCLSCNTLNACRDCDDWIREATVSVLLVPDTSPMRFITSVQITEHHNLKCPRARNPAPGITRSDLRPEQRSAGPRNRFNPVAADLALNLNTHAWPGAQWLYRAFDDAGELLYVGITGDVAGRMRAHRRKSRWWATCDYLELTVFRERFEARAAERRAIRTELPRFNDAD